MNVRNEERDTEEMEMSKRGSSGASGGEPQWLVIFKALTLLALLAVIVYGTLYSGLYFEEDWLPVAGGILLLTFITLFIRPYYRGIPKVGWILLGLLGMLVFIKGLSLVWTISESLTIRELLRSAMYLAAFGLALAAISYRRQIEPVVDALFLALTPVVGYGLLQKIDPVQYPIESVSPGRIGSTLDYANTFAMVAGLGIMIGMARLGSLRNPFARGAYAALLLCLCVALFFTFSRGGFVALGAGLLVFFVVGSDRLQSLANLLLFSAPLTWLLYSTRSYEALYEESAAENAATAAGSAFLTDLVIAVAVAFVLQAIYAFIASRYGIDAGTRKLLGAGAIAATVVLGAVVGYAAFFAGPGGPETPAGAEGGRAGIQDRLTSFDSLRYEYWKVGLEAWRENPLTGTGAGTFQYTWLQERSIDTGVKQVHNLYLEQGTETGIFAFAALAAFAVLLVFHTAASAFRTPHSAPGEAGSGGRTLLAGLSGAIVLYLASSALEWHWYIPASTLYFFVLAAVAVKYASFLTSRGRKSAVNTDKREKGEAGEEHEGLGERERNESSEAGA